MSKAHDPHWRYVAFRLDGPNAISRRALGNAIKGRFRKNGWPDEELPQLTRFEWPHAIVKVNHFRLADCRETLPTMDWAVEGEAKVSFKVETLSSSGTIKSLTDRIGFLKIRGAAK
jgi:RNase P/RNase MRP subunit POP5